MPVANRESYLADIAELLRAEWPNNRTVNVVCHGHSVPAGYFATPTVATFDAYPYLIHRRLKERFPHAIVNVIVTATGGESSDAGAARFRTDVLTHRPDLVTIDYGLNDRRIGLEAAGRAWEQMIGEARETGAKLMLLTPTGDVTLRGDYDGADRGLLEKHAELIRGLAARHSTALGDPLPHFQEAAAHEGIDAVLSWPNHPNRAGHEIVAREVMRWFPSE